VNGRLKILASMTPRTYLLFDIEILLLPSKVFGEMFNFLQKWSMLAAKSFLMRLRKIGYFLRCGQGNGGMDFR
jgi:hypothetical protein